MFQYISGTLRSVGQNSCVIDTGGIGWLLFASDKTCARLSDSKDEKVCAYTYLNVREDAMELFGFATLEELSFFKHLISVSGVGPKAALAILSALSVEELSLSVLSGDAKAISAAQGIGLKTAQKVILELKDKIAKDGTFAGAGVSASRPNGDAAEAVNALIVLGYQPQEAANAVSKVSAEAKGLQDIIRRALKRIGEK